ncbi:hypothetical protein AD428_04440 [Achromobacter sp. DMS1]|nr:hypothetical protein AD428_04440 [Achromobacter sp. DMS1]
MDHIDGIGELGDVDDPESAVTIANADFSDTLAHCVHRLPVIRIQTVLHLIDLVTRFALGRGWEGAKIIK